MTTITESKKRTITLTDRAPIRISESAWPIISTAKTWDNTYECQANRTWSLRVRQHADGRAIVYGVTTSQWQGERDTAAGELLDAGADIAAAIHRVAEDCGCSESLADECIADLPAQDLV